MNVEPSIFKAYDIRGTVPDQIDESVAYAVARGFATLLINENPGKQLTFGIGGDMRTHTPGLKAKLIEGIVDSGVNVVDFGLVSTPAFYFGVSHGELDGGIVVTASHNNKTYNGFKMVRRHAEALGGKTGIMSVKEIIANDTFVKLADQKGDIETIAGVTHVAIEELIKLVKDYSVKGMKIVIDPANAMGILDCEELFAELDCEIIKMNFDLDGNFPAHEADPLKPENTADLQAKVLEEKATFGIGLDGDADRIFIIDERGRRIPSSILYTILGHIEHEENPGEPLAYEIRLGNLVEEEFKDVHLIQTPVGHSLIKAEMVKQHALFGGEISGHYFFRLPWGTYEAPALLVLKFATWLSKQEKPLAEIVDSYTRYISSGEINTKVSNREEVESKVEEITNTFKDGKQIKIDGIKVSYPRYWFSVRASNTEPLIRLVVEAKDKALMEEKRDELLKIIQG